MCLSQRRDGVSTLRVPAATLAPLCTKRMTAAIRKPTGGILACVHGGRHPLLDFSRNPAFRLVVAVTATLAIDLLFGQIELMSSNADQIVAFMAMTLPPFFLAELILPAARDGVPPGLALPERFLRALLLGLGWSGIGAAIAVLVVWYP